MRILIVEDEKKLSDILERSLGSCETRRIGRRASE